MKKNFFKYSLAFLLVMLMIMPVLPVRADEVFDLETNLSSIAEVTIDAGNGNMRIATKDVTGNDIADDYFDSDGSYTIHIPENSFSLPYEVRFFLGGGKQHTILLRLMTV